VVISEPAFYVFLSPQVASSVVWSTDDGAKVYVDNGYPWREKLKVSVLGLGDHVLRATVDGDKVIEVPFTLGSSGVQASLTPTTTSTTVASVPKPAPTTTTTTRPTLPVLSVPSGGVVVRAGESIQGAVDSHPGNTTFVIKAGVYRGQEVRPKAGNIFVGESGAVLDGGGKARWAFSSGASNVTIRGLVVQNYASPDKEGAINREGGAKNWLVEGNEVRDNSEVGIRGNSGWRILGNYVHGNGRYGITGSGIGLVVEGNEIANNAVIYGATGSSGGTKFVHTEGLVLRNNFVHDNQGNGLWADINNLNVLFEGNRIVGNLRHGINFEISCGAVIRNNYLEGNGFLNKSPNWMNDAGILVSTSPNVDIYGNTLVGNNKGIGLIHWDHNNRDAVDKCVPALKNVKVHDNRIVQSGGAAAGLDAAADRDQVWTSWGNQFSNNTYQLSNGAQFRWQAGWVNYQQWKDNGQN
jgi:hypothetical protein